MKTATYYLRGLAERWTGTKHRRLVWREVWSENGDTPNSVLFPWMTRNECLADARARGYKAVFRREA